MKKIKKLLEIFECFSHEQILEKISGVKLYLQEGSQNLPIDVTDSLQFLKDLEILISSIRSSPRICGLVQEGDKVGIEQLVDTRLEKLLKVDHDGPKLLRADLQRILTEGNLEHYLRVTEFLETIEKVFEE